MPHNVISDALNFLERRPRRGLISFFLQNYPTILGITISLIMALSALPYAPIWTVTWIGFYWVYHFWKQQVGQKTVLGYPYHSKQVQFGRASVLLVCTTIFLGYLYLKTGYLTDDGDQDTIWLLFLLSTFIMSQYGITELLLLTVSLAAGALVTISLWAAPVWSFAMVRTVTIKVLWLALLAFMLHILLRYILDWYANIRLLHEVVGEQMLGIRSLSEEQDFIESIARRVAEDFNYPHVNVLYVQPDGSIKYMAGACAAGRQLAQEGYLLLQDEGIIRHVVQTGRAYIANDVDQDPHYRPIPAFPQVKAELAVPIKYQGRIIGVLDIQSQRRNVFFSQDVEVMEIMGRHFVKALDNIRLLRSRQQINGIVETIAQRFLSHHELQSTLSQITQAAHVQLQADVVVVYEHDPLNKTIIGPVCAGELFQPELFSATAFEPDSIVRRLLLVADQDYFQETVSHIPGANGFHETSASGSTQSTFVAREKIKSRVIIRLRTGANCVGLIFLNFRSKRCFDEAAKKAFHSFADLAALAIQKAQFHQQQIEFERETLAAHLHDQLMANADAASRLIQSLLRANNCPPRQHAQLLTARDAISELKQDICYLNETFKDTRLDGLREEVDKLIQRATSAYGVEVDLTWNESVHSLPPALTAQIKLILNEAVINAIRHGEAKSLCLFFTIAGNQVQITVVDNGCGFDPARVKPSGLDNMRKRAERLGGACQVTSQPGKGTSVNIKIPYEPVDGGDHERRVND